MYIIKAVKIFLLSITNNSIPMIFMIIVVFFLNRYKVKCLFRIIVDRIHIYFNLYRICMLHYTVVQDEDELFEEENIFNFSVHVVSRSPIV